ncbi:MAG TPA: acylphosphatase [Candidatus Bathyarchaeia archaeon]|jgi:acylphosphatase|nr:acylphosphatase [Candidatus Bathyarchaeia archaeon]
MKARAHALVSGRVQGVFFRSETKHEAERCGVKGWVRNLSDGRVEAVFEGEEESVRRLVEFFERGPPDAEVTSADVVWEPYRGEFKGFEIRYSSY